MGQGSRRLVGRGGGQTNKRSSLLRAPWQEHAVTFDKRAGPPPARARGGGLTKGGSDSDGVLCVQSPLCHHSRCAGSTAGFQLPFFFPPFGLLPLAMGNTFGCVLSTVRETSRQPVS